MSKRTKLSARMLPNYTKGEEIMNMVTHIVGGAMAVMILLLCICKPSPSRNPLQYASLCIYAGSMITVYAISSIYHGLRPGTAKKVLQVLDHCAIYLLIAGTYTPVMVCGFMEPFPVLAWVMLTAQWGLSALAVTLNAIDLKKYTFFSMLCYILLGWGIIFFIPQTLQVFSPSGFNLLLAGGISYTIGAVLYGIGARKHWMHSVFHIFVVVGSLLQFLSIYLYVL